MSNTLNSCQLQTFLSWATAIKQTSALASSAFVRLGMVIVTSAILPAMGMFGSKKPQMGLAYGGNCSRELDTVESILKMCI